MENLDLGDLYETKIDNNKYSQMWNDLMQVDGFIDYLEETKALDIKRFFHGSPDVHPLIKGHYQFANYLHNELVKRRKEKLDNKK